MTKYINKETGDIISSVTYNQLSSAARNKFVVCDNGGSNVTVTKSHTIIETRSDSMSIGEGIAAVAFSPIVAGILISSAFKKW